MVSDILFGAVMGTAQAISSKRDFEREVFAQDRERAARMDELRETYRIQGENALAVKREELKQQEMKSQAETDQKRQQFINSYMTVYGLGENEARTATDMSMSMGFNPNVFVSQGGITALTVIAAHANKSSKRGAATGEKGTPPLPEDGGGVPDGWNDEGEVPIGTISPHNRQIVIANGNYYATEIGVSKAEPTIKSVTQSIQKSISDPNLNTVDTVQTKFRSLVPQDEIKAGVAEPKYPAVVFQQNYLAEILTQDIFQDKTFVDVNGEIRTVYYDGVRPGVGTHLQPDIKKASEQGGIILSILASNPQDKNKLSNARRKQLVNLLADAVFSTAQEKDKVSADVLRVRYEDTLSAINASTDDPNLGEDILASYTRRSGIPGSNVPKTNGIFTEAREEFFNPPPQEAPASTAPTVPEAEKGSQAAKTTPARTFETLRKMLPPEFQGATDFDDLSDMVTDKIIDPNTPASQKPLLGEIQLKIKNLREGQQAGNAPSEGGTAATPNDLLVEAFSEQYKDGADVKLASLDRMLKERGLSRSDIENVKWMKGRTGLVLTIKGKQWPVEFNNKK